MLSQVQDRTEGSLWLLTIKKSVTVAACHFRELETEPGVTSTCGLYSDTDSVCDRIFPEAQTDRYFCGYFSKAQNCKQ